MMLLSIGVLLVLALGSQAFAPTIRLESPRLITTTTPIRAETVLFGREDDTIDQVVKGKKKSGLEDGVRTKLMTESIAPWRTVRLFLYFALGSGAAVGGLITLSGVAAGLSGARTDLDMNTEVRTEEENWNDAF